LESGGLRCPHWLQNSAATAGQPSTSAR
jgi:hypothetical protein